MHRKARTLTVLLKRHHGDRPGSIDPARFLHDQLESASLDLLRQSAGVQLQLVTSDAHRGLVEAIGTTLPGAAWQRCRTH
jgi:hypothetical protein